MFQPRSTTGYRVALLSRTGDTWEASRLLLIETHMLRTYKILPERSSLAFSPYTFITIV